MAKYNTDTVPAGTPPQENPEAQQAAAEEQQVHEEAAERRTTSQTGGSEDYDKAYADYEEKQSKLGEALRDVQVSEQGLSELRIRLQQAKVDEAKQQDTEYADDGRLIGAGIGTVAEEDAKPVSNPQMYGGNPDPKTLRFVH